MAALLLQATGWLTYFALVGREQAADGFAVLLDARDVCGGILRAGDTKACSSVRGEAACCTP